MAVPSEELFAFTGLHSKPASLDKRTNGLRLGIWLSIAVINLGVYGYESALPAILPALAALASVLPFWHGRISERRASELAVVFDLIFAATVVRVTGGFSSPYTALYFVVIGEAFSLSGAAGALRAAVCVAILSGMSLRHGLTPETTLSFMIASSLLIVSAGLLAMGSRSVTLPRTLLKTRSVEDMESDVESLEEENRRLRATYQQAATTIRTLNARLKNQDVARQLLAVATDNGDPTAFRENALRIIKDSFDAFGAVLWLADTPGGPLRPVSTTGNIPDTLLNERAPLIGSPSQIRQACESRLESATLLSGLPIRYRERSADAMRRENALVGREPDDRKPALAALLRQGGEVFGAIGLTAAKNGLFEGFDAARFQELADLAGDAFVAIEQRARDTRGLRAASMLGRMSELARTVKDPEMIYERIVDLIGEAVDFENCTLFAIATDGSELIPKATRGNPTNILDHIPFDPGCGISGWVASRARPLIIPDLLKERGLLGAEQVPPRVRSFAAVPMMFKDRVIGVVNISHSRPHAFRESDTELLMSLTSRAGVAINGVNIIRSLERLALTDDLTGLYNYRYLDHALETEIKRARRYGHPMCLVMIDIDHFKAVNDGFGHAGGNQALQEFAALIQRTLRETEVVARFGGEEFAILMPQTAPEDARIAAERLRRAVSSHEFMYGGAASFRLTISLGIAGLPIHATDRESLLSAADRALYAAKSAGRNRVGMAAAEPVIVR